MEWQEFRGTEIQDCIADEMIGNDWMRIRNGAIVVLYPYYHTSTTVHTPEHPHTSVKSFVWSICFVVVCVFVCLCVTPSFLAHYTNGI